MRLLESAWPVPSSLRQAAQLHSWMMTSGALQHIPALTHLLKFLAEPESGNLCYALAVFHRVPEPPAYLWNTIIRACPRHGVPEEAFCLYQRIRRRHSGKPNAHTFKFLFQACTALQYPIAAAEMVGQSLHAGFFKQFGACGDLVGSALVHMYAEFGSVSSARRVFDETSTKDVMLWTTMVSAYSKSGSMENAQKLFDGMPVKNVVSWTSMVSGYSKAGRAVESLECFRKMVASGITPDSVSVISVLPACAQLKNLELGRWLNRIVNEQGAVKMNPNLVAAFVDMYSKCGDMDTALRIFDSVGRGTVPAWNAVIDGYCKMGNVEAARHLFDQMGANRDCISFNSMITGYVQNSHLKEALLLFEALRASNLEPDKFTMAGLLGACAGLGALHLGRALHAVIMESDWINMDAFLGTSLLDMYAKCGRMDQAMQVFSRMNNKDAFAWTAVISGLALHGMGSLALEHFSAMLKQDLQPTKITYVGVLNACSHSGLLDEGRRHFNEMRSLYKIEPEIEHYGCMVDLMGRVGCLKEAEELIRTMPMAPNDIVWNSLLSACRVHKHVDLAERVAGNLLSMEHQEDGVYVQLYNVYISCGKWNNAREIRKMMDKRGIKKVAGFSFILVGGKLHKFSAGDRIHPEITEIRETLTQMTNKLKLAGYVPIRTEISVDMDDEEKEHYFFNHSERLAVAYGIMKLKPNIPIHVMKNLRICEDCHSAIKLMAVIWDREIVVRDRGRFHHFRNGRCSCDDFW